MKLSIFKKMMVGLAAMAGLASAGYETVEKPNLPVYLKNFRYELSTGRMYFEDSFHPEASYVRHYNFYIYARTENTAFIHISDAAIDRYEYGVLTSGSITSSIVRQDGEGRLCSGVLDAECSGSGLSFYQFNWRNPNVYINIGEYLENLRQYGITKVRILASELSYNTDIAAHVPYITINGKNEKSNNYGNYFDIDLTPGSISWYASSFTHDGETTKYTESTAPTHFDFIRSKDVVNMQTTITDGSKNNVELECLNNSNGLWESKDVYYPSSGVNKIGSTLQFNDDKYESCVVNGATAKFRWKMYQSGAVDTLYTDEITLNMPYKLTLGETEHGSQKVNGDAAAGYGKAVDLQYKPDEGYEFECWQNEAGECVTSESNDAGDGWMSTSITLIGDTVLSAKFKPLQYRINWFVPSLEDGATNPWFKIYDYGTIPVAPVSLTSQVEKEDNEKYHYIVKVVPEITAVTQDQDYSIVLDSVLNDLSLHFNLNYAIGEDVSIEFAEPNECLDVEKLSLRVYNDEGYSEGFALFNYKTNEWLAGGDGESEVHLWANKWNRFDAGVTLPKTGDCLNDEYVKSVNYAIQNNEDGKALVNIYINGEYSGRNRLDATNPDILFNYKFATTTYTVTWIVEGETVETDNDVVYGSKPKYDGETPTKAADDKYTYEFADWKADVEGWTAESVVKSDVKFTAQFKSTEISSSSKEEEKSSSSEKLSSSSSAKEDKSSSSTKLSSSSAKSSSSTKPKSSSSKTDAVVATAVVPQFSLSVAGRNVQIAGARIGASYAVMDMQGRVLATGRTASASMEIAVPRAGSYVVRVGSQTKRVNVK